MAAISTIRMSSAQMCCGTLVGVGLALAVGVPTVIGAVAGAAIAKAVPELSRGCRDGRRRQDSQRFEHLLPTDQASGESAAKLSGPSFSQDLFPVFCSSRVVINANVVPGPLQEFQWSDNLQQITADVVHLADNHWIKELENNPEHQEKIWNSQKAVAEYLLSHPEAEVFDESVAQTSENAQFLNPHNFAAAQEIFPDGLPSNLNSLNSLQRRFFREIGATLALHHLGKIKTLRRAISPERLAEIDAKVEREFARGNRDPYSPELKPLMLDARDEALIKEIKAYVRTARNPNRQIIIVYGASHNFAKYFNPRKYSYIRCQ